MTRRCSRRFGRVAGAAGRVRPVREVAVSGLCVGMIVAVDVRAPAGRLHVSRGHVVTEELLERLRNYPPDHVREPILVFH